ncbi:hypothetical protein [Ralstonia solanacearum]|uniref:Transmembrane protein n=1 Tax=Ralstonia solanacearum CFBP2957 TaxID=859656 RepID=D8P3Y9_RALSL|nr:hypothetical protein [Ralstonia solanacearum]CBJ53625.1 membrane protein of unknown function [Ralstonia solanacearum CFBP2957]
MSNENQVNSEVKSEGEKKEPRQPHVIALNGLGALLCAFAAVLSFMGESAESIEIGALQIFNLPLFVGIAAFACFLATVISMKMKWGSDGSSWIKSGVLIFLVLIFSLVFVFREPASLAVQWDRLSPVDETVHYQYRFQSNYYSYHTVAHDRVRNVGFIGSKKSFRVVTEGDQYESCRSSSEACELRECLTGQIWWLGGLQWGIEAERDSSASGESKALTCQPVDAQTVTLDTYDEYGYRYE